MIHLDKKIIFIHIAKTGGSSVRVLLTGDENIGIHYGISHEKYINEKKGKIGDWTIFKDNFHIKYSECKNFLHSRNLKIEDFFIFAFTRNPWDLAVSRYNYWSGINPENIKGRNFESMLKDKEFQKVLRFNRTFNFVKPDKVNYFVEYENIQEDWKCLAEDLGFPIELPHYNKASEHVEKIKPHYRDYYSKQSSIDIIARIFKEEIDYFGYKF